MHTKIRRFLTGKPIKIGLGVLGIYFAFAYLAINPIAQHLLPWVAENKLASRMTVERVRFDPLRLILTVDRLQLSRPDGAGLAGFEHLTVDLESSGLFHLAWRLKDIRLTAPHVNLEIAPDGKFNWTDLIAKLNEDKTPDDGTIPRLIIDHLLIERGNICYTERNHPRPFKTVLQPLGLELEGLSTLPADRGDYLLSAKLPEQGGTLKWKGDLALNPLASKGSVDIQNVSIAKLMQVIHQESLPFKLAAGTLETRFRYDFSMVKGQTDAVPQARLSDIAIHLSRLASDVGPQAKVALESASVKLPGLDFSLRNGVQLQFQGLEFTAHQASLTQGGTSLFKLDQAEVKGVDFDWSARRLKIAEVGLERGEVNANRAANGSIDWQAIVPGAGGASAAEAVADTNPQQAKAAFGFDIASVQLHHWKAVFSDQSFVRPLRAEIKDINFNASFSNADGSIAANRIDADFAGIALRSGTEPNPAVSLAKASLKNGTVNLNDTRINLPEIVLSKLQTEVTRETDNTLNWQTMLARAPASAERGTDKGRSSGWKVALDKLSLENGNIHLEDKSTPTPVVLDLQNAMLELRDGSLDLSKPLPVRAGFQFKQGGRFDANGKLALAPLKGEVQIRLEALSLKPFSPYVNQQALLKLSDGQAGIHGKLALSAGKSLTGRFAGGFSINHLAINEEPDDALFLGWDAVSSDTLKLGFSPLRLHMDALRIQQPTGKLIIYEDKTLNVKRMLRAPSTANVAQPASKPLPVTEPGDQQRFAIVVDRVSIENGNLDFADLSLTPQFGTHINTLSGVINGLSNDPDTTAQVELDGKVDDYGSARVRGSVQPFRATDFTDLKVAFHNLEMNRLTPYSGKFAGRKIDSGKLSVDLEYKIKHRQLTGENKFIVNRLKLGARVDSPDAMHLPLDLAIALLENSDGLIDLDLPITGSLDDPQFSYGRLVWKAIANVLGKVVTAPFRALGKLLGISADKLEAIAFEPGKATLAPPEQEKLKALSEAMAKRKALMLTITPAFDAVRDKAALQEAATRRDVSIEMGLQLKEGEPPGPVDLNNAKAQTAVENLLKDRKGIKRNLKALDALKSYFRKTTPEELQKYRAMLDELKSTANVTPADLVSLAKERSAALQGYLEKNGGLEPERVGIAEPVNVTADGDSVKLKLALGAAR